MSARGTLPAGRWFSEVLILGPCEATIRLAPGPQRPWRWAGKGGSAV